jgi:polysaccharide biosynthesis/export protein
MNKVLLLYILLVIIFLSSCRSASELTMFQDLKGNASLFGFPSDAPEYLIKPFDNLYLSILTLDPQVNQLFNPSTVGGTGLGTGTQQMYGDRASQYINGYMVTEEGFVTLPILGQIKVAGLNLHEAQEQLKQKAEEYLKEPNVKVKVLNFKINVTGEVQNPGLYYNYEGNLNIIDAISMANGITQFANLEDVLVIRHNENETKTYNLNLTNKSVYLSDVFYLQPNDIVYIKPNKNKRANENNNIYSLVLSTVSTLMVAITLMLRY